MGKIEVVNRVSINRELKVNSNCGVIVNIGLYQVSEKNKDRIEEVAGNFLDSIAKILGEESVLENQ